MFPKFADEHADERGTVRVDAVPVQDAPASGPNWFKVAVPEQACVPLHPHVQVYAAPVALV
jgi:hypothetical protein